MRWIVAVVLVGCGGGSGGGDPVSGPWSYVETDKAADSCGLGPQVVPPAGTFDIVNNGDGTMTVDDGQWVFECTLSAGAFDCPDRFPGGLDSAGVHMDVAGEAHGTFDSDTEGSGGQTGTASCADAECEAAAAMLGITPPCDVDVSFTISFDG